MRDFDKNWEQMRKDFVRKRRFLWISSFILIVLFIAIMILDSRNTRLKKEKYKEYVGKEITIDGHTHTIVDYSTQNETFKLSNGVEVDQSLILKP